jgi:cell division control protein 6
MSDGEGTLPGMVEAASDDIFEDRGLLKTSRIVDHDRIVGRDEQIKKTIKIFTPLKSGDSPPNLLVYGPSGTGKSLILNRVGQEFGNVLRKNGQRLGILNINCQWIKTNHQAAVALAENLESKEGIDPIRTTGKSTNDVLTAIFSVMKENFDASLIMIDEIDTLVDPSHGSSEVKAFSSLIYQLSRSEELAGLENVCVIAITNSPDFMKGLDSRAESSFNPRSIAFGDYTANQLREILNKRRDAFVDGVLEEGVIPLAAAHAASDHGDARKAVDLFRSAGTIAFQEDTDTVTESHVRQGREEVERDKLLETVNQYNSAKRTVLLSLAMVEIWSDQGPDNIPNPVLEHVYEYVCELLGTDVKSDNTIHRYTTAFETHGILDSDLTGRGRNKGMYKQYRLNRDAGLLIGTIMENDESLEELFDDRELISATATEKLKKFNSKK